MHSLQKLSLFLMMLLFVYAFNAFAQEMYPKKKPAVSSGKAVYDKQCATCHGPKGDGKGAAAAGLNPKPTDFTDHSQMRLKSPAEFYDIMIKGKGAMPSFKSLKDDEAWDVVSYLITFSDTKDMAAKGKDIYFRDCAFCHGKTGAGDGPGGASLPLKPRNFADIKWMAEQKDGALYQNMTMGIPTSGIACAAKLKPEERWNVLSYIRAFTYSD
ncbi:MAG: c-type cytochrome [Nitrospirota bacterium]